MLRLLEIDDLVLSLERGLEKVEGLLNGFIDELAVVPRMVDHKSGR